MRDLYIGLSGAKAQEIRLAVISNNLANANTVGYKRDQAVFESLLPEIKPSFLAKSTAHEADLPPVPAQPFGDKVFAGFVMTYTQHNQGLLRDTGNPLDFAIDGPGFFAVETPAGERYTRAGNFQLTRNQELTTPEGFRVLGDGGPIRLDSPIFSLTQDGTFVVNGEPRSKLRIVRFEDVRGLEKEGKNLFKAADDRFQPLPVAPGVETQVRNNTLEYSNVNMVDEMVRMIEVERAYGMAKQAIETINEVYTTAIRPKLTG